MHTIPIKQHMLQLSSEAGEYLRHHFYTYKNVFKKQEGGLVTNIDLELEANLVKRIKHKFPDHGIIVHSSKTVNPDAESIWIVDALDGSSHFSRNIPIFTTTLAFQHKGETLMSSVNSPQTKELFFAEKGKGAYLNGIEIKVSEQDDLEKSFVYVELPEDKFLDQEDIGLRYGKYMAIFKDLAIKCEQVESFRIGTFGMCLVASGAFDAYVDLSGSSQKTAQAASRLIVEEAGGEVADLDEPRDEFVRVMACNPRLRGGLAGIVK